MFTPQNAEVYGAWLGARYHNVGVIWVLGGDRRVETDRHKEIIRATARGLRQGDNGNPLIVLHPPGGAASASWFHDEAWLDFNLRQNGHVAEFNGRYDQTRADYDRTPVKPVLDAESIYGDQPDSFDAKTFGHSLGADVRRPLYWDLFGGACGHTYGHHAVRQLWTPEHKSVNDPLQPWCEAIVQPGAAQMQHARALLESHPFLTRVPAPDMLVASAFRPRSPVRAAIFPRGPGNLRDGVCARRQALHREDGKISGTQMNAWWFNPRDGTALGTFDNRGERTFTPPKPGELLAGCSCWTTRPNNSRRLAADCNPPRTAC